MNPEYTMPVLFKQWRQNVLTCAVALTVPMTGVTEEGFLIEEVIVSAQKREQSLQDVPVSVNAIAGVQISERGIDGLEELSAHVPNLTIHKTPDSSKIYIRGLGSGENKGFEQSVGLFIDGVYGGRARQFMTPFLDVARVEVLRGPQGTLFGKNTIAGAVTIHSAQPSDELEASLTASYEPRYQSYSADGVLSGPITERLKGRLAVRQAESDGFMENTSLDSDEAADVTTAVRGTLLWDATDDLQLVAKYAQGRSDVIGRNSRMDEAGPWLGALQAADPAFAYSPYKRSTTDKEFSNTDNENFTLTVNYSLGEYEITAISGYSEYQLESWIDSDFSAIESSVQQIGEEFEQWSQELRLTSPLGGKIDYIAGLYFQASKLNSLRHVSVDPASVSLPGPRWGNLTDFDQDSETYAIFGSMTWHATDVLHLTAGLRYTVEEKDAARGLRYTDYLSESPLASVYEPTAPLTIPIGPGVFTNLYGLAAGAQQLSGVYEHDIEDDRRVENISPSLKLQYDLNDDVMLYASIGQAYKSGGFNAGGTTGDDPDEYAVNAAVFDFDEEEALAFEVGGKTRLLAGRATLNFALFRTDYNDLQVSSFEGGSFIVDNAAETITQGLEVDGTVLLTENLTLNGSFAYLDATYSKYESGVCTALQSAAYTGSGTCTQNLTDRGIANAPEWSASISLDHEMLLNEALLLRSHLDIGYTDEQYLAADLDPHTLEESHYMVNGRVALSNGDGSWEVALVGKNLTDEEVRTFSTDPLLLSGAYFAHMDAPRTLSVQLKLNY